METKDPFYLQFLPIGIRQQLAGRHNLFAVLHNSGWLLVERIFKASATIFVGAWVARYLGPEDYGKLAYVLSIVAFFQVICTLGLDGIVVRNIARDKTEAGVTLGTTFLMRFLAGILSWLSLVVFMIAVYGFGDESVWLAVFVGGGLIFQSVDTIDLWFQSQTQSKRTVFAKFIAIAVSTSLRVAFILIEAPLIFFAIAFFVEFGITALALYVSYKRFECPDVWTFEFKERGKTLLRESWPFLVSSASVVIYMRFDQIMIRNILGEKELGIYSAVIILSTGWNIIANILYTSMLPMLTKSKEKDEQMFLKRLAIMFRVLLCASAILILLMLWQGENLISLLYGDEYMAGSLVLSIHIFTNLSVFLGVGQVVWIVNYKKPKLFLIQTIVGCVVSLILNVLLIPILGLTGAALSASLSFFASAILTNLFMERDLFKLQLGIYKKI